jgi:hypothetical protein
VNEDAKRNLNPHKSARMAMYVFSRRYAAQNGGSMDFWDSLSELDKNIARECVSDIEHAEPETK